MSVFDVEIRKGHRYQSSHSRFIRGVEAPNDAAAVSRVEALLEAGEFVPAMAARLASSRAVEPMPVMPADHARNVATGRRGDR